MAPGTVRASQLFEKGCGRDSANKKIGLSCRGEIHGEMGRPSGWLIGRSCLGVAAQPRSAGTAGCLLLQAASRYVAARWALRTTGAVRGVRIELLIGNNTLPTWAGASRALARLAPSHLVTYPHQLTLRSSQLASPQGSSLHRLLAWRAWLLGVSCGLRLQDALEADGAASLRLGTAPGTAFALLPSGSFILLASSELSPQGH